MRVRATAAWAAVGCLIIGVGGCVSRSTAHDSMALSDALALARAAGGGTTAAGGEANGAAAGRPHLEAVIVSLRQCLEWALAHNLRLSIERLSPDLRDAQVVEALSAFDALFASGYSFSQTETPVSSFLEGGEAGDDDLENQVHGAQTQLTKRLVTGTQARLGMDWTHRITTSTYATLNPSNNASFSAALQQPLLRDFGVGVNTAAIRIARYGKEGSIYQFRQTVEATLQSVEETYWTLYLAIEELKVRQRQLERAKDLLDRAEKLVAAGRAARVEVTSAQAEVARVQSDIVNAENVVRQAEDLLKRLVNHPDLPLTGPRTRIVPADAPRDAALDVDPDQAIAEALAKRPDLKAAELQESTADVRVRVAENQLLPRLDLGVEYTLHGLDRRAEKSIEELSQFEYEDWRATLTAQIPLGNRAARSRLTQAKVTREQVSRGVADARQQIVLEVTRVIDDLRTDRERIRAAREASRLARERLRDEEALYRSERSTRTDLLQAQTNVAERELDEIRAVIRLNIDQARLLRAQGTFLEQNKVEIASVPGN